MITVIDCLIYVILFGLAMGVPLALAYVGIALYIGFSVINGKKI